MLNKDALLPSKNELLPPTELTFSECFWNNGTFSEQHPLTQLQVIADTVRQSMLIDYCPSATSEFTMSGDCSTAAKVFVEYANTLDLGFSFQLAIVRRRACDSLGKNISRHVVVVEEKDGFCYIADPTPLVGPGYGTVQSVSGENLFYENTEILSQEEFDLISQINELRRLCYVNSWAGAETDSIRDFESVLGSYSANTPVASWIAEGLYCIGQYWLAAGDNDKASKAFNMAIEYDPDKPKFLSYGDLISEDNRSKILSISNAQKVALSEYVNRISAPRDLSPREAFRNYSNICLLKVALGELKIPQLKIDNVSYDITSLSPRWFAEKRLLAGFIKPITYVHGVRRTVMAALGDNCTIVSDPINVSEVNSLIGFPPIVAMHPHGVHPFNQRVYSGKTEIFVAPISQSGVKKAIRNVLFGILRKGADRVYIPRWSDGEPILYVPFAGLNHLHMADGYVESSCNIAVVNIGFAVMDRWAYPNPRLLKY
jgi:hypothetical protein